MESISSDLLEKHRDINLYHGWWEYIYGDFKDRMELQGITVDDMYFSGFCSQGDGACFEGCINPLRFLRKHFPKDYPMLRKLVGYGGRVHLTCKHSGHYSHEFCTTFSLDVESLWHFMPTHTELHEQVVLKYDRLLDLEVADFEEKATKVLRGYMRQLYRELEQEHDHLVSDTAVWDSITMNDLDKEI